MGIRAVLCCYGMKNWILGSCSPQLPCAPSPGSTPGHVAPGTRKDIYYKRGSLSTAYPERRGPAAQRGAGPGSSAPSSFSPDAIPGLTVNSETPAKSATASRCTWGPHFTRASRALVGPAHLALRPGEVQAASGQTPCVWWAVSPAQMLHRPPK